MQGPIIASKYVHRSIYLGFRVTRALGSSVGAPEHVSGVREQLHGQEAAAVLARLVEAHVEFPLAR